MSHTLSPPDQQFAGNSDIRNYSNTVSFRFHQTTVMQPELVVWAGFLWSWTRFLIFQSCWYPTTATAEQGSEFLLFLLYKWHQLEEWGYTGSLWGVWAEWETTHSDSEVCYDLTCMYTIHCYTVPCVPGKWVNWMRYAGTLRTCSISCVIFTSCFRVSLVLLPVLWHRHNCRLKFWILTMGVKVSK